VNGSGWTVRAYQTGDERAITDLFARAFGKSISEAHWMWKLRAHDQSISNVWLALDGDKIIFHYGGLPLRCKVGDVEKLCMVSVDAMTDPHYQRRGLLTRVGRRTFDIWAQSGAAFTLGLPNERWGSRTQALGWLPLFRLQWLIHVLRPASVLARRMHLPFASRFSVLNSIWKRYWNVRVRREANIQVCEVKQADARFDALWRACAMNRRVSFVRDRAWVNWRYCEAPGFEYHVLLAERETQALGYLAYRVELHTARKVGAIAELFACDEGARGALIGAAVDVLDKAGVEVISTLAVPGTLEHTAFRRAGFVGRASFGVDIIPFEAGLPMELLRDPKNWMMAGGDFDVI
jgi:hypothetical protein